MDSGAHLVEESLDEGSIGAGWGKDEFTGVNPVDFSGVSEADGA